MRLIIKEFEDKFFIEVENYIGYGGLRIRIGLTADEYFPIMEKYAHWDKIMMEHLFRSREAAQMAIDELEAIMVINKLIK